MKFINKGCGEKSVFFRDFDLLSQENKWLKDKQKTKARKKIGKTIINHETE